jgi:hypothetical protein
MAVGLTWLQLSNRFVQLISLRYHVGSYMDRCSTHLMRCVVCGSEMEEVRCEAFCRGCGYRMDCSDV